MEDSSSETEKEGQTKNGLIWRVLSSAEVPFFFYVFGLMMHMPILQQYTYLRFSRDANFPYHFSAHRSSCEKGHLNETLKILQEKVQMNTAHFQIAQSLCSTLPSLIMCLIYGSWSDKVGRKPLIVMGMLGALLDVTFVFITIVLDLPLYMVLVGNFFNGLGGYYTGLILAVMAYIADTTSKEDRALRLGILEAVVFFGSMISNFLSGHFLSNFGFAKSYILVLSCLCVSFFSSIFLLQESLKNRDKNAVGNLFSKACFNYPVRVWKTLTKPRPHKWKIAVIFPATLFVNMLSMGVSNVIALYVLNSPFCLPSIEVGYFAGTRFFVLGFGAALGIKILRRFIKPQSIALLGVISYMCFYTILSVSKTQANIYEAIAAGVLSGTVGPIFRSILSETVGPEEQGALFSAVASFEMLAVFIGSFIFNAVYPIANDHGHPGAVFYLCDAFLLLPLAFNLIYTCKVKKEIRPEDLRSIIEDSVTNPGEGIPVVYGSNCSTPPRSPNV